MRRTSIALMALAAAAGCATSKSADRAAHDPKRVDTSARAAVAREDMLTQMTFWAQEVQRHPDDIQAARSFIDVLRRGGRASRAVSIGEQAIKRFGPDRDLLAGYGQALVAAGRGAEAVRPLAAAVQADPQNWRLQSALGVAFDQAGRPQEARAMYRQALAVKPDDAAVLTNYGMSFLLTGEASDAETILRQAAALPTSTPETRMNLAVAIALQGRFDESERLQRVDLPAQMAAQNIAYLRGLVANPGATRGLMGRSGEKEATDQVAPGVAPAAPAGAINDLRGLR